MDYIEWKQKEAERLDKEYEKMTKYCEDNNMTYIEYLEFDKKRKFAIEKRILEKIREKKQIKTNDILNWNNPFLIKEDDETMINWRIKQE